MKYRPPLEIRRGRLLAVLALYPLNLPRLYVIADGDLITVGFSYGADGCDPVVMVDLDLSGTRVGDLVSRAYWWLSERGKR